MNHLKKFNEEINSRPIKLPPKDAPESNINYDYLIDEWERRNGSISNRRDYNKAIQYATERMKQIREEKKKQEQNPSI